MKILVTGASGFIASHLCEHLVRAGHQVRAFLHYNHGQTVGNLVHLPKDVMAEIQGVWGDVRELHDVLRSTSDADVIYHLAALVDVPWSLESPRSYLETNLMGTYNILEAARYTGAKVVIASSSEVYGDTNKVLTHLDLRKPRTPYAASKVSADAMAMAYHYSYNVPIVILRAFNTYGPWQSVRAVIPHIITELIKSAYIHIGNVSPKRSFLYVEDLCEAYLKCLDYKNPFLELVVGNSESYSIGELITMIEKVIGKHAQKIHTSPSRERDSNWEIYDLRADTKQAKEKIGWEPKTGIEEGLEKKVQWFQDKWK